MEQAAPGWWGGLQLRLRRVTSSKSFIPEIDGLRFLAIITVVLLHLGTGIIDSLHVQWAQPPAQDWLRRLTASGGLGVNVFFAISGFVLALPFAQQHLLGGRPVRLAAYFWRRVTRLEPPYFVIMVFLFLVHVFVLHSASFSELLPHLGASLLYLHCIIYGEWSPINPVTWSLETEVQFYILAPVFAQLYRIGNRLHRRLALVALMGGLIALSELGAVQLAALHLDRSILAFGHLFLVGFLFADIYLNELRTASWTHRGWDFAAVGAILGLFYLPHNGIYSVLFTALLFLLFVAVFNGLAVRLFFRREWITAIGGMCYTIYLIHYAFILLVLRGSRQLAVTDLFWVNYLVQAALVLPLLFAASAVFFLLVEKPCMYPDWPQRLGRWFRGRTSAAPG